MISHIETTLQLNMFVPAEQDPIGGKALPNSYIIKALIQDIWLS